MSTVSRYSKKIVRSRPAQMVGATVTSKWTWGSLLAGVMAFVGYPFVAENLPSVPQPKAPTEQSVPLPSPPASPVAEAPVPAPAPVGNPPVVQPAPMAPDVKPEAPAPQPPAVQNPPVSGPCYEKKPVQQWQTYTYQQKYVGDQTGKVIYKPATGKKLVTTYQTVRVPCPPGEAAPPQPVPVNPPGLCPCPTDPVQPSVPGVPVEVKPVNPPVPPAPSVVVPGTVMYGVKGLGGIGDAQAFKDFATARGYVPVWIDTWEPSEAESKIKAAIKKSTAPYALYGFSLGAKTVRDFALGNADNPPTLVVTVGASSIVEMDKKFDPKTKVEHYFHTKTKHDVDGVFIQAPHTGTGNIQRIIADEAMKAKPKT